MNEITAIKGTLIGVSSTGVNLNLEIAEVKKGYNFNSTFITVTIGAEEAKELIMKNFGKSAKIKIVFED